MACGGIFQLITNDGIQDRMLMANSLLQKRLHLIENYENNYQPSLKNIEKTVDYRLTTDGNGNTSWRSRNEQFIDIKDKESYIKDIANNLRDVLKNDIGMLIIELNIDDPPPEYVDDLSPPLPDYCNDYEPLEPPPNYDE